MDIDKLTILEVPNNDVTVRLDHVFDFGSKGIVAVGIGWTENVPARPPVHLLKGKMTGTKSPWNVKVQGEGAYKIRTLEEDDFDDAFQQWVAFKEQNPEQIDIEKLKQEVRTFFGL